MTTPRFYPTVFRLHARRTPLRLIWSQKAGRLNPSRVSAITSIWCTPRCLVMFNVTDFGIGVMVSLQPLPRSVHFTMCLAHVGLHTVNTGFDTDEPSGEMPWLPLYVH